MVLLKALKRGKFKGGKENAILSAPSAARLLLRMERKDHAVGAPNPAAFSGLKGKHCPVHELNFAHQKCTYYVLLRSIFSTKQHAMVITEILCNSSSLVHPRTQNFLKEW